MKAFGLVVDLETDKVWFSSTELYVEWQTVGNHHRTLYLRLAPTESAVN